MTENIDGAKIFIWANVGEKLKELDETRLLAIAEHRANYSLSIKANRELMTIIKKMKSKQLTETDIAESIKTISAINEIDNTFREISEFLHEKPHDLLSIGSLVIGELESKNALLDLSGDSI